MLLALVLTASASGGASSDPTELASSTGRTTMPVLPPAELPFDPFVELAEWPSPLSDM
jgi:hypothetical protein